MASKANGRLPIKSGVLVVGIDVAKRRHVAAIRLPDGRFQRPFSFSNDREGFAKLLERVELARAASGSSEVRFGLEATGHYGHALQHFLLSTSDRHVPESPG